MDQVTAVLAVPVTWAAKLVPPPAVSETEGGLMVTSTDCPAGELPLPAVAG